MNMKRLVSLAAIALFLAACNNGDKDSSTPAADPTPAPIPSKAAKSISYSIVQTYPHDTSSFTQGLVIYNGNLYEGTGERGHSHLLKTDLKTGKIEQHVSLAQKYFGEGITILRDTVYQLTWQERVVFVYTLKDFKKVKEFAFNTDGWGITTDGKELLVSDGSSNIYYYNPSTFQLQRTQTITEDGSLSYNLNELEYIDGFIYANQWQAPYILKIDPGSGSVVGKIDLTNIWNRVKAKDPAADVPNGIAYDSNTKKIYITGKKWPELYEVQLGQ
ncbi:MAG: glutaminyl-peptide cyclotransferase [Sphingobacteriales bacterium]|nr:MAG: glutaminyl-peptide cyclotransferase [Sphingobacteriales bacterium]